MSLRNTQSGLTLVELMIAMTLGVIMAGGVVTLFTFNRHSFNRDEMILRMQDDARQGLRELINDLSMAGYWADLMLPATVTPDTSLAVGTDCGPAGVVNWIYQAVTPGTGENESLMTVDNATAGTASASFSCLGAEVVPGHGHHRDQARRRHSRTGRPDERHGIPAHEWNGRSAIP